MFSWSLSWQETETEHIILNQKARYCQHNFFFFYRGLQAIKNAMGKVFWDFDNEMQLEFIITWTIKKKQPKKLYATGKQWHDWEPSFEDFFKKKNSYFSMTLATTMENQKLDFIVMDHSSFSLISDLVLICFWMPTFSNCWYSTHWCIPIFLSSRKYQESISTLGLTKMLSARMKLLTMTMTLLIRNLENYLFNWNIFISKFENKSQCFLVHSSTYLNEAQKKSINILFATDFLHKD